jgi:hypothetical protein
MIKTARVKIYKFHNRPRLIARPQARLWGRRFPIGFALLYQFASVALALFLTAGFAVALSLFAGRSALDPGPLRACALFFTWCVMLFMPTWNA